VTEDFSHFAGAIEFVTRVQKLAVVVAADQLVQLRDGQTVFPKSRTSSSAFFFSKNAFALRHVVQFGLCRNFIFDFAMCYFTPSQAAETIARFVVVPFHTDEGRIGTTEWRVFFRGFKLRRPEIVFFRGLLETKIHRYGKSVFPNSQTARARFAQPFQIRVTRGNLRDPVLDPLLETIQLPRLVVIFVEEAWSRP